MLAENALCVAYYTIHDFSILYYTVLHFPILYYKIVAKAKHPGLEGTDKEFEVSQDTSLYIVGMGPVHGLILIWIPPSTWGHGLGTGLGLRFG